MPTTPLQIINFLQSFHFFFFSNNFRSDNSFLCQWLCFNENAKNKLPVLVADSLTHNHAHSHTQTHSYTQMPNISVQDFFMINVSVVVVNLENITGGIKAIKLKNEKKKN